MSQTITVSSAITGKSYQYIDNGEPMRGAVKDVYFSPDRTYVVAFYRDAQDFNSKERLRRIVTDYYTAFFKKEGGDYYKDLYCWPTDVVEADKKTGLIVPTYKPAFSSGKDMPPATSSKEKKRKASGLPPPNSETSSLPCGSMIANSEAGSAIFR